MNTRELWQSTLGQLELKLSKAHFTTWFRNTFIAEFTPDKIVIGVPNTFTKTWLEKKYHRDISTALQDITEQTIRNLEYRVETEEIEPVPVDFTKPEPKQEESQAPFSSYSPQDLGFETTYNYSGKDVSNGPSQINTGYTFHNFVVGKQNELAHAAAEAVTSQPGGTYNPLFIYGGVGLGKTHLLHAVGNAIKEQNPHARMLYVTCETFTNDFIQAVRSGKAKDFKDRYRNVDLLLIDDIQFITGKEGTQEEFFHTFNALHQTNKQIIISSDRAPKQIAALEKRLLSRLEWGMLVDIGAPDLETRIAILQNKCHKRGVNIPREILHFIADTVQSNVRELEGALNKVIAYHEFKKLEPTLATCKPLIDGLKSLEERAKRVLSPNHIIQSIADYYGVSEQELLGKSREKRIALPRQIAMYLMREELQSSYPSIGRELGGRDHTTAMHAYTKISKLLDAGDQITEELELIRQKITSV
jgi:chromosomal replication initiator protein